MVSKHTDLQNRLKNANAKQTTMECQLQSYNKDRKAKMKTLATEKEKLGDLEKVMSFIQIQCPFTNEIIF